MRFVPVPYAASVFGAMRQPAFVAPGREDKDEQDGQMPNSDPELPHDFNHLRTLEETAARLDR